MDALELVIGARGQAGLAGVAKGKVRQIRQRVARDTLVAHLEVQIGAIGMAGAPHQANQLATLNELTGFDNIKRIMGVNRHVLILVLGIESRGFIVGAAVAYRLGVGMAIARKPGKLPYQCVSQQYKLEYGVASLEIHQDAIAANNRVLIVDDLLATGGTAEAAIGLVDTLGGGIVGCAFIIELGFLHGRERVAPAKCFSLIRYD